MIPYAKLRPLVLYSLIPPSVLVLAIILFDPYQVIRPVFGMRNLLSNLAFGTPIIFLLWLKVWLGLICLGLVISGLTMSFSRYGDRTRITMGIVAGISLGLLVCIAIPENLFGWRDIPFGWTVPLGYGIAGAIGGITLVCLTLPDN